MVESLPSVVAGRWRPSAGFVVRAGRRTLVESLYLLTAPFTAAAGLLLMVGGLCVATVGSLLPGGSPVAARSLALARWSGDLEWWRIGTVRSRTDGTRGAGRRPRSKETADATGPGLWLDLAHAVSVLPVVLVTSVVTVLWWFVGAATATYPLRIQVTPGSLRPMTLYAGSDRSHIALSLGLTAPTERLVFAITVGVLLLFTLPLVTRVCVAAQAGLGQALLSSTSVSHRRTGRSGQGRDTARGQAAAAVTAEAVALRRLERDIHDGPQQQLVRLAMELGRAQHHFDRKPELVRAALADAVVQTQEALDELRALSRGIAPPVLTDRGLREALSALVARCVVPAELDADPLSRQLDAGVETAAYFVVAEALTNVAKHSHARRCTVGMRHTGEILRVRVTDDGVGGAALAKGHGLQGLADRVHAVGGRLRVDSPEDGPTTVTAELPCR
ncbi:MULTISPECIES: sensor histidine kinase [unclassified Streptomyces]|uniref:sensor histidine kinase n=1 Tax=unclassified Streptomyces TaxID=2593676 RepID=UPI00225B3F1A|nr:MULTISPECIES: sensor histidine kinase [unclassified Streptomyces]MCX4552976.1 sensor histidine kinase [Streptomyces sp. NBC_01500]WSC24300.1 sensor histidine kinase [Streptomyces sp. NBC_01766]